MYAYDFWLSCDREGEAAQAFAEAQAEAVEEAWLEMGYRERADLIDLARFQYRYRTHKGRPPYGYDRKTFIREFIGEKLG